MAHNKLYRNFIILQEDERGYSHSNDKALSGYAKVEAKGDKCKVSFYAQNLKQEDNYSMVLICCKRDLKQLIDLGPLTINGVGKGDTSKDYYVNNIAGLGISYEKISGAAICKVKDNENEFVMHGFMNGEDSSDNWRKFKIVKVDSKKYINKLDEEPQKYINKFNEESKKKDISSLDIADKAITSKTNNVETSKFESGLVDRKKYEKENIELESLNNSFKEKNIQQNMIIDNEHNINILDDDRNKCKDDKKYIKYEKNCKTEENKKCVKCDNKEKIEEYKKCVKCDNHEMSDNIEEAINKLGKKLETCDGSIDLKINNVHEDVVIYGFIKYKKNCDCKWKKFKVEKKFRNESQDFCNMQGNSKRIQENFELDKLNEFERTDRIDRLDIVDFDEYENEIKQVDTGTVGKTGKGNIDKLCSNKDFNMNGEVGKYFQKIAEDFEPYKGSLADINYCKFYKINVNGIEDLSDESNYNQYTLAYYPMLNYYPYIGKEGHFLLGYKCNSNKEMKYIVYAIPGSKDKNDQPYGGRTGFVTWTSDNTSGKGYWLMFYDFKNCSIVIPTK